MKPLLVKEFTATSCIGRGLEQTLDSLPGGAAASRPVNSRPSASTRISARSPASTTTSARRAQALRLPQQPAGRARLARRTAFSRRSTRRRAAAGADAVGVFIGTSTSGILETELAYRERDPLTGALPASFDYARDSQLVLGGRLPAPAAEFARPGDDRVLRLRIERQGVRLGAAHDRGGSDRCRRRGRGGLVVLDHAVRLSLAAAVLGGAVPPIRHRARRHLDRRSRGVCPARAGPGALAATTCCCWASANRATPITCRRRTPRAWRAPRDARGAPGREPARMRSTTSTCTAPARRATTARRARPSPAIRSRPRPAVRPRARPDIPSAPRARRSGDQRIGPANGFMPGGAHTAQVDPALTAHYLLANRRGRIARVLSNSFGFGGDELQPDIRARRMMIAASTSAASACSGRDSIIGRDAAAVLSGRRAYEPAPRCCRCLRCCRRRSGGAPAAP